MSKLAALSRHRPRLPTLYLITPVISPKMGTGFKFKLVMHARAWTLHQGTSLRLLDVLDSAPDLQRSS